MTPKKKIKFDIKFVSDSFTIKPEIEYYGNKILCFVNFYLFYLVEFIFYKKITIISKSTLWCGLDLISYSYFIYDRISHKKKNF